MAAALYNRRDWFPLAKIEGDALLCPGLAHLSATEVFMDLDELPDLLEGCSEWVTAHALISVRPSPRGWLYSDAAIAWLHLRHGSLCCLCGTVERGRLFTDDQFCRWLVGRQYPFHSSPPICSGCNGRLHIFGRSLGRSTSRRFRFLENEAEYVAALHEITKSHHFRQRLKANAEAWRNLRFDPRREPEARAAA